MIQSLQSLIAPGSLALQTIPLMVRTVRGKQLTFVIVESEYDQLVYNKFFNLQLVHIFTSSMVEKNYQESCTCVEAIVYQITQSIPDVALLGIRDVDYTAFNSTYSLKANIFSTDARDIEMMMFGCSEVKMEFNKITGFDTYFTKSVSIAREIGFYRLINDVQNLGFSFKANLKFSEWLDARTGDLLPEALTNFEQIFLNANTTLSADNFRAFKITYHTVADNNICRGHDVITLLANYLKNRITKKEIELTLAVYYAFGSFQCTALYNNIYKWGVNRDKVLFRI